VERTGHEHLRQRLRLLEKFTQNSKRLMYH
jgi:hypothetical protein